VRRYDDKGFPLAGATTFAMMNRLSPREALTFDHNFAQYGFQLLGTSL
jgi:predicted nucleic acid-binding protein